MPSNAEPYTRFYLPRLAANEEGLCQLRLDGREVVDEDAINFANALSANTQIETVTLSENLLTDAAATAFAALIAKSEHLTVIDFSKNKIGDDGVTALTKALNTNHSVTELNAGESLASSDALAELAAAVELNRHPLALKDGANAIATGSELTVDLSGPSADASKPYCFDSARLLARSLSVNKTLTLLDFSNNCRGDDAVEVLSTALGTHPALLELRLDANRITDRGAAALSATLRSNTALTELRLSDNEIGDRGAQGFIDLVRDNETLSHIVLDKNNIMPSKQSEVVHSLLLNAQPPKLKAMHPRLLNNDQYLTKVMLAFRADDEETVRINDISCRVLSNCLRMNTVVRYIDLAGNRITDAGAKLLAMLLKSNITIAHINLRANCIGADGARHFIDMLPHNNTLESLDLTEQRPTPIDEKILAELQLHLYLNVEPIAFKKLAPLLIESDPSVRCVDLSQFDGVRRPTHTTCRLLCDALRSNSVVEELVMSGNPQIGRDGVEVLLNLLIDTEAKCPVRSLHLSRMKLGDEDRPLIAELLRKNDRLTEIDLSDNGFNDLREWTDVLRLQNHQLRKLNLGDLQGVPADDIHELQVMLDLNAQPRTFKDLVLKVYENDAKLTEISLVEYESTCQTDAGCGNSYRYRRRYDDKSVELLAEALRFNRHVENLNLACNSVGDRGAMAIAEMLRTNRSIGTLSLANNAITDAGFMAIADALLTNPTLQCVVVDNNPIKDPMTRKHLNMATSHNAMVGATVYTTVDTTKLNPGLERELDDAVMQDAIKEYSAPSSISLKHTLAKHGEATYTQEP